MAGRALPECPRWEALGDACVAPFFFFNAPATTEIYTLSLHDALPICVMPPAGPLRYCDHIEARGEDFFDGVEKMGLEGVVAKKSESKYRAGRSSSWLKIRVDLRDDFTVAGYTLPKGARGGFGALHLAHYRETEPAGLQLVYAGRVGTGFSEIGRAHV